jgi:hypothetical protein
MLTRVVVMVVALLAGVGIDAREARAWWYVEHAEIGTAAYAHACERVRERLPERSEGHAPAEAIHVRFEIACDNLAVVAELYGQTNALAGDRLDDPDDFLTRGGDWKVGSQRHYYALGLVDVHHFHPAAPREWMRHHLDALELAVTAARAEGLDAIDGYQRAFYRNAFADHFLQDSYCAGHMGFNRSASSIAATQAQHDYWNRRGRRMRNRAGDSWLIYGDGKLNDARNAGGRERVIGATAMSAYGVIASFVFGERDREHELAIWRELPFLVGAPPVRGLLGSGDDDDESSYRPLAAINQPARVDRVVDVAVAAFAPGADVDQPTFVALVGFDVALPLLSTQAHLSVGGSTPHDEIDPRFAAQLAVHGTLGLSFDGLFSHHVAAGFLWEARADELAGWATLAYVLQVEIGLDLLLLQLGPSLDARDGALGTFASIGYGRVFGTAGGGIR